LKPSILERYMYFLPAERHPSPAVVVPNAFTLIQEIIHASKGLVYSYGSDGQPKV